MTTPNPEPTRRPSYQGGRPVGPPRKRDDYTIGDEFPEPNNETQTLGVVNVQQWNDSSSYRPLYQGVSSIESPQWRDVYNPKGEVPEPNRETQVIGTLEFPRLKRPLPLLPDKFKRMFPERLHNKFVVSDRLVSITENIWVWWCKNWETVTVTIGTVDAATGIASIILNLIGIIH